MLVSLLASSQVCRARTGFTRSLCHSAAPTHGSLASFMGEILSFSAACFSLSQDSGWGRRPCYSLEQPDSNEVNITIVKALNGETEKVETGRGEQED